MRLVRYGRPGKEKPGLFDDEGRLRDLSGVVADIDGALLNDRALRKLAKKVQDARWAADEAATAASVAEYQKALDAYLPGDHRDLPRRERGWTCKCMH